MTDLLAVAREEGAERRQKQPRWVVVWAIRSPWAVLAMVGGEMPYLTRRASKDLTIASKRVTWDQRMSSLTLVSMGRVVLERLEQQ